MILKYDIQVYIRPAHHPLAFIKLARRPLFFQLLHRPCLMAVVFGGLFWFDKVGQERLYTLSLTRMKSQCFHLIPPWSTHSHTELYTGSPSYLVFHTLRSLRNVAETNLEGSIPTVYSVQYFNWA